LIDSVKKILNLRLRFIEMRGLTLIAFLLIFSVHGLGQNNQDSCLWNVPMNITHDCTDGDDFVLKIICSCELEKFELEIYNKWGKLIFESSDIKYFWDASQAEKGSYFWKIDARYENGDVYENTGLVDFY